MSGFKIFFSSKNTPGLGVEKLEILKKRLETGLKNACEGWVWGGGWGWDAFKGEYIIWGP